MISSGLKSTIKFLKVKKSERVSTDKLIPMTEENIARELSLNKDKLFVSAIKAAGHEKKNAIAEAEVEIKVERIKAEETVPEIKGEEEADNIVPLPHYRSVLDLLLSTREEQLVAMAKSGNID